MNASSFARSSLMAASLCAAFAATGCIAADGDDFDDEGHDATEEALSATNASKITSIAASAGQNALGAAGGAAFTKVLGAFGIYGTSNISEASMQEIASLVGTTVRSEFLNTYEARLHAAYVSADIYSRTCTTPSSCKKIVATLQSEAMSIYNDASNVAEYYKLDSLLKDRLTVAPQLVNALTLKSSFLVERYQLYKLQNPGGNNSAYRKAACDSGKDAVTVMHSLQSQFVSYVETKIKFVQPKRQGYGCGKGCHKTRIVAFCFEDYGSERCVDGDSATNRAQANAMRDERVAETRLKILGDGFNSAQDSLTEIGNICN